MSEITETTRIEAFGVKGVKNTSWRRTFKNLAALRAWTERNDSVEVHAISAAD